MSPLRIVKMAQEKNIDIVGICDHNSAENVKYAINAADRLRKEKLINQHPVWVLAGMEICTKEEVHILGIFNELAEVVKLNEIVYQNLPAEKNRPEIFGEQIIANEFDEIEGYNEHLLIGACNLSLKEVIDEIHKLGGIAIASHIDREGFSLIAQLGFIPENLELDAVEISASITPENALKQFPELRKLPLVRNSDAHFLDDIGRATTRFLIEEPTIEEIKKALRYEAGRKYEV